MCIFVCLPKYVGRSLTPNNNSPVVLSDVRIMIQKADTLAEEDQIQISVGKGM